MSLAPSVKSRALSKLGGPVAETWILRTYTDRNFHRGEGFRRRTCPEAVEHRALLPRTHQTISGPFFNVGPQGGKARVVSYPMRQNGCGGVDFNRRTAASFGVSRGLNERPSPAGNPCSFMMAFGDRDAIPVVHGPAGHRRQNCRTVRGHGTSAARQ